MGVEGFEQFEEVTVVAFGDEFHVYPVGSEAAGAVYLTAIGANLDAVIKKISVTDWNQAVSLADDTVSIHDHRESQCYCENDSESCPNCNGHEKTPHR